MKLTGKLLQPQVDYLTGRMVLLFAPNEDCRQLYEELKDKEKLSLEIKPFRKKRTLDANAYYWVLLGKLAKVLETSTPELHNRMLREYGEIEMIDGQLVRLSLPDTKEAERTIETATTYHLRPTTQVIVGKDGKSYRTYLLLKGSHTYNTEEFSRLLNGLISDCKDANIPDNEIASSEEQRVLKERYGVDI